MFKRQDGPPFRRPPKPERDDLAIAALVENYSAVLYRVAYSVLRNTADAEDAVQEAFLRVLKHRDELDGIRDKRTWLVRIVWNAALDKTRRAKTRPENEDIADYARVLPSSDLRADDAAISAEERAHILALVDQLPAPEREALLLSVVKELSTSEIAAVLKTTQSAVRARIFRARRELAALMVSRGGRYEFGLSQCSQGHSKGHRSAA